MQGIAILRWCARVVLPVSFILLAACSEEPAQDEPDAPQQTPQAPTTPEGSFKAPPVENWQDFTDTDQDALLSQLGRFAPAAGQDPAHADAWREAFALWLPQPPWTVSLGTASPGAVLENGFTPFLVDPGTNAVLTEICALNEGCQTCTDVVVGEGETTAPKEPEKDFTGICATLSTAYSLVYVLGKRTEFGQLGTQREVPQPEGDPKRLWKKGFLDSIRQDQGHRPGKGTRISRIKDAYVSYGCTCDGISWASDAASIDAWIHDFKSKSDQDGADCHFDIRGVDADGDNWAHDMWVSGIVEDPPGKFTIGVTNTGRQGGGAGDDVPVLNPVQTWEVTANADGSPDVTPKTSSSPGSLRFWQRQNATDAGFFCCRCPSGNGGN